MKEQEKTAVIKLLQDAEATEFFGEITFKLRGGKIYQILKAQSLMMEDVADNKK